MWDPQRLTTLWAFTACYRDSFTYFYLPNEEFDDLKAYKSYKVGFEVLTTVLTKRSILWGYKAV
jgi:hypothetical protein